MTSLNDSIFLTVKKMLGIAEEYKAFDLDLVVNINSTFLSLCQLGVGPRFPFSISGEIETWSDLLGEQEEILQGVATWVFLKTRLIFDPPTQSFLIEEIHKQIDELEWRLNVQVEGGKVTHGSSEEWEQRRLEERRARRAGRSARFDAPRYTRSEVGST